MHLHSTLVLCAGFLQALGCTNVTLLGSYRWQGTVMTQTQGGPWVPVCGSGLNATGAMAVCSWLGYSAVLDIGSSGPGGSTTCRTSLCGNVTISTSNATVVCKVAGTAGPSLSLVGGAVPWEGLVQVTVNGINGSMSSANAIPDPILNPGFNVSSAICRDQGYTGALRYYTNSASLYGTLSGPQWIDSPVCTSSSDSIFNCSRKSLGPYVSQFGHATDLAVECIANSPPINPVPVRLAGGINAYSGRVELYYNGHWGTVNNEGWAIASAHVVCRQMRLGPALATQGGGNGVGTTWLRKVACLGTEQDLASCPLASGNYGFANGFTSAHTGDVVVNCSALSLGGSVVRLNGTNGSGRVEVFYGGVWGTVCANGWTASNAAVVCKQLGYAGSIATVTSFGPGEGIIWMENVRCNGTESWLSDCPFNGWGVSSCKHQQDVGVTCDTVGTLEGKVRLVKGSSLYDGRAQVFHSGNWWQICSVGFDLRQANVVCRQLGFYRAQTLQFAVYCQDVGTNWVHVNCTGSESSLNTCSLSWDTSCNSCQDMTIVCSNSPELPVMLVGGASGDSGRVHVFYNSTWGTVCSDGWTASDATVVCRMLGFSSTSVLPTNVASQFAGLNQMSPIWLSNVQCLGTEKTITNCPQGPISVHTCTSGHTQDAGVFCQESGNPIRLVGGSVPSEGKLEVYYGGQWGGVCSDFFTLIVGYVACRQLGYTDVVKVSKGPSYATNQAILLSSIACNGNEPSLVNCSYVFGTNQCTPLKNTWLVCEASTPTEGAVKLSGAGSPSAGRVEVFRNGQWSRVCQRGWDMADAQVVCRQLNFQGAAQATSSLVLPFGPIYLPTSTIDVGCNGTEQMLISCTSVVTSSSCDSDAAVVCTDSRNPSEWDVRLVQGTYQHAGVAQVGHLGVWGAVCDKWTTREAQVACRQMNYEGGILVPYTNPDPLGTVFWLTGLNCTGNELRLDQCNRGNWMGQSYCSSDPVAIQCSAPPTTSLPTTQSTTAQNTMYTGTSPPAEGSGPGTPSVQTSSTDRVSTTTRYDTSAAVLATTVAAPIIFVGFFGTIVIIVVITAACKHRKKRHYQLQDIGNLPAQNRRRPPSTRESVSSAPDSTPSSPMHILLPKAGGRNPGPERHLSQSSTSNSSGGSLPASPTNTLLTPTKKAKIAQETFI